MSSQHWLTDEQMARLPRHFPDRTIEQNLAVGALTGKKHF